MTDQDQRAAITWTEGGVPVSARFDDPYYSLASGLDESRHVFLSGNDLPARFTDGFQIAELGFGTGLNLLAALDCWRGAGIAGRLRFTSFEAFPMTRDDMARALAAFDGLGDLAAQVLGAFDGRGVRLADLDFTLVTGDARRTLAGWTGRADAWFLDGFAPARNPEMWGADLMAQVGAHTAPGGTFATYTAAGDVRRALDAAGFDVTRQPGYGRKRHMSRGVLRGTT